jgi:hypothetical protein
LSTKRRTVSPRSTVLERNVLVVGVTELAQGLPKCLMVDVAAANPAQKPDMRGFLAAPPNAGRCKQQGQHQSDPAYPQSHLASLQPEHHFHVVLTSVSTPG